jgi:hypothetical protein
MTFRQLTVFASVVAASATFAGCSDEDPCQDYIDYVCNCEDQEACDETTNTYSDADAKLQDECQIALEDQQAADEEAGTECSGSDTGA